jgi:ABC-2 type transport system permease protein
LFSAQDRFAALTKQPLKAVGTGNGGALSTWESIKSIHAHREVLALMVRRDLKARYKDSALGLVWTLVRPLTQLFIYYIVMGKFLGAERGIPDFAIYVFTGLTVYGLLSEIVSGGTSSIVGNGGLIKKIYLPREVFPLASVGSALFNFCIQMVVLLVALFAVGHPTLSTGLLYFFPALAIIVIYGTAFALLLSATNVYLRDVQYLVDVVLLILLWASPIVYSWEMARGIMGDGLALALYTNNPTTLAVLGFQQAFWVGGAPNAAFPEDLLLRMGIALIVGIGLLFGFHRIFARLQGNFAQEL